MKTCRVCKKAKPLDEFYKRKGSTDGRRNDCKDCNKKAGRKYYSENAEKQRVYRKEYYKKNKDKILANMKEYYENNKDEFIERANQWATNNPEKRTKIAHRYYRKTIDIRKEYHEGYYKRNKERLKPIRSKYKRERMANDIEFKLACSVREKTCKAIKYGYKHKKTLELLGCNIKQLKKHLEQQFEKGMTWDNWGRYGWHIDHIIPIASFDLTKEDEQEKCFHYTNLQPLWATENLKKQDKTPDELLKEGVVA